MDNDKITVDEQLLNGSKTNKEGIDIIKEQMINFHMSNKERKRGHRIFY